MRTAPTHARGVRPHLRASARPPAGARASGRRATLPSEPLTRQRHPARFAQCGCGCRFPCSPGWLCFPASSLSRTPRTRARVRSLAVREAGDRIGYVHVDDTEGRTNRHWPLFQGVLTPAALESTLDALLFTGYGGPVAIELSRQLARPLAGLVEARDILLAWDSGRKGAAM